MRQPPTQPGSLRAPSPVWSGSCEARSSVAPLSCLVGFVLLDAADLALHFLGVLALAAVLALRGGDVARAAQRFGAAEGQFRARARRRLAVVAQAFLRGQRALRRQAAVDPSVVDVDRVVVVAPDQLLLGGEEDVAAVPRDVGEG